MIFVPQTFKFWKCFRQSTTSVKPRFAVLSQYSKTPLTGSNYTITEVTEEPLYLLFL